MVLIMKSFFEAMCVSDAIALVGEGRGERGEVRGES